MQSTYLDLLARYGINSAHPGGFPLTMKILNSLQINSNTKLLDLGCGTGQTLAYIAGNYPCRAVGVDINDEMLRKAAQRFKEEKLHVDLFRADVMCLPFPPDLFDIALSESVTVFTTIDKALGEYARVLKKGGMLLAIEMTALYPLSGRELEEIRHVYGIPQLPGPEEWEKLFRNAGFTELKSWSVKMNPTVRFSSPKMIHDFYPHLSIMRRYRNKLGYMVFQCRL